MDRPYHWLRRSRNVGFPRRQIALVVSWERVPRARAPNIADDALTGWESLEWSGGPGSETFEASGSGPDADSFWRWLGQRLRRKTCTWVWQMGAAHGLTLLGFWRHITDGTWVLSQEDERTGEADRTQPTRRPPAMCVISDPPTIIMARPSGASGTIRIVDVRNLGVDSWPSLGGGRRDAHGLASWIQAWCRTVDDLKLGGLRHTAAAQAWHGWRHSYMQTSILIHGNSEASQLERDSVHPGRAEAYRLGLVSGGGVQIDAASHYPSCCTAGLLPVRLRWCGACDLRDVRAAVARGWLALCECRVTCERPILPCRQRDRTIWPVGTWRVTLPWPEVEAALARGCEVLPLRCALYEGGRPCDAFMSAMWRFRVAAARDERVAEAQCTKLLLNSLIGKWAARGRVWSEAPEALPPSDWFTWSAPYGPAGALHKYRTVGWHPQREDDSDETPESCPALAAWTYSVGRVRLLEWMETAGAEDCYYVDSDGGFFSAAAAERLAASGAVRPGVLGALRVQGVLQELRISGIRDYAADGRTTQAGTPTADTLTADGVHQWWRERTVREAIGEHRQPVSEAVRVRAPVIRTYRHGHVGADGRVTPYRVEE